MLANSLFCACCENVKGSRIVLKKKKKVSCSCSKDYADNQANLIKKVAKLLRRLNTQP